MIDVAWLEINSPAAIQDDVRVQAELERIQCAVFHAVIQCEAHEINVVDRSLLQIISKPGFAAMGVIEERAVAVDPWIDPLVEDVHHSAHVERRGELCTVRVLNAMHRPKDLFDSVEDDAITWFLPLVICREAAVVGRMAVLRGKNKLETLL